MIEIATRETRFKVPQACLSSPVSIGRDSTMQWVIAHWRVARRHAVLLERSRTLWIQDLGTWSGTWVNGKRIVADTPLLEGDTVVIGPVVFSARCVPKCPSDGAEGMAVHARPAGTHHSVAWHETDEPTSNGASVKRGIADGLAACERRASRSPIAPPFPVAEGRPDDDGGSGLNGPGNAPMLTSTLGCQSMVSAASKSGIPAGSESLVNVGSGSVMSAAPKSVPTAASESMTSAASESMTSAASGSMTSAASESMTSAASELMTSAASESIRGSASHPEAVAIRQRMQLRLLSAMDLRREDVSMMSDQHLRARARAILEALIERDPALCPVEQRECYITAVIDEAVGLGPLEPLLADASISEIMVNRHDEVFVERAGRLERADIAFANEASVLAVLERIVAPLGRRIDEGAPMVDARLADGSRVNGVIAPIALKGPTLTIRKFSRRRLGLDELVAGASMSATMAAFLGLCVRHKKNIVVSGGTGSGKTTLLNILSGLIGRHERIITIEDAAELQLPHAHVVSLEARPPNIEGRGCVDIRDLVRNALRMRPDRIIVGECRGGEAFDMLAAMNTGHEGSLTTLHANTPRDALARLETMILMTGMPLPLAAVREHISAGIDIVVQQARLEDGRRVLTDIAEVSGMDSGGIQLQSLFVRNKGRDQFEGAGVLPSFVDAWRERGIEMPTEWFDRPHRHDANHESHHNYE